MSNTTKTTTNPLGSKLPKYVITQALLFTIVFTMRDSVASTLDLIPFKKNNIFWKWGAAIAQLTIVIFIFYVMWWGNLIQIKME
jgi:hypothetical protein